MSLIISQRWQSLSRIMSQREQSSSFLNPPVYRLSPPTSTCSLQPSVPARPLLTCKQIILHFVFTIFLNKIYVDPLNILELCFLVTSYNLSRGSNILKTSLMAAKYILSILFQIVRRDRDVQIPRPCQRHGLRLPRWAFCTTAVPIKENE